jgi:hypothetical protein
MRAALRQLGVHDVYHMQTTGTSPGDIPYWTRAIDAKYGGKGHFDRQDWDELLATFQVCTSCPPIFLCSADTKSPLNLQASTDVPASFFGTELAHAYPEAKVVILNREREKWYESCMTSIHAAFASLTLFNKILIILFDPSLRQFGMFMHKVNTQVQGFDWPEKDKALAFYDGYYREWRREIPSERILEYRVQDGWGPLCKHLGIPVPMVEVGGRMVKAEFPRLNDGASMRAAAGIKMRAMRKRVFWKLVGWVQSVGFLGLLGYVLYRSAPFKL